MYYRTTKRSVIRQHISVNFDVYVVQSRARMSSMTSQFLRKDVQAAEFSQESVLSCNANRSS